MSPSDDLKERLTTGLEPVLAMADPTTKLSAYHDMPYAIFRYDPDEEWELRRQVGLLETRLKKLGKRVHRVSLAECLTEAMVSEADLEAWRQIEIDNGGMTASLRNEQHQATHRAGQPDVEHAPLVARALGKEVGLLEVLGHRPRAALEASDDDDGELEALCRVESQHAHHVRLEVDVAP